MRVITYGTFDTLHFGHIRLLQRAKLLGTHLTVGLSTDAFNKVKGKSVFMPYDERKDMLLELKAVDEVVPEDNWAQKINDIQKYRIDIFTMGDDWKGEFDSLSQFCRVQYLERTPAISSTLIKQEIAPNLLPQNQTS